MSQEILFQRKSDSSKCFRTIFSVENAVSKTNSPKEPNLALFNLINCLFIIGHNGEQLKEMRDLEPKYFLLTQYLLVAEMLYSFLPTLKIQNFREAAICRQKTYTKTRTFFRCC